MVRILRRSVVGTECICYGLLLFFVLRCCKQRIDIEGYSAQGSYTTQNLPKLLSLSGGKGAAPC